MGESGLSGQTPEWLQAIPALADIDDAAWLAALGQSQLLSLPAESIAFNANTPCDAYLILLEGQLRVQQVSSEGREVMLYRVGPGQACVLTVAYLLANLPYSAQGVTETPVKLAVIPRAPFLAALHSVLALQNFVFGLFCNKLHYMMGRFEQMAFGSVELRLARHLSEAAKGAARLRITHEKLAHELGTDRVVVSRALKEFERQGLLVCGRSQIDLVQDALQTYIQRNPL